ncbi:transposase [Saccharopolyspora sp. NPDC002686]|uniref:RNA-guided endonuclease InsQ/TnpB family protein n=1 Tax=Saccharopolyspora sp. NPDC002686 TaxID=3154541 RepID=UPI00332D6546
MYRAASGIGESFMLAGRRYRLMLTPEQVERCEEFGRICRSVWNTALEQRREYRRRGSWINYEQQAWELADAKGDHEWLKLAPAQVLQQTLMDLERACRERGTWRVNWRSQRRWSPSFRFPTGKLITTERIGKRWGRCKLPKLGWVRFRWTRALGGIVRSATVSRDGPDWFVSFLVDTGTATPEQHAKPGSEVGIDRGVVTAVATSDSVGFDREFTTAGEQRRYLRLQRKLARQQSGSANRAKTLTAMRRIKRAERNRRKDFCAQVSHRIADEYALIVLERLHIRNMTASARGTVDDTGSKVSQKSGLNRNMLGKGWHAFELALRNAARSTGSSIVKVPAAHTSQRCFACHTVDQASRESQAVYRCTTCEHTDHADVNAAKNILAAGRKEAGRLHAVTACGDLGVARSAKQEPGTSVTGDRQLALLVGVRRL